MNATQTTKGPLPAEGQGLCWGGFFLTWIWALGNSTWIGLLAFIPVLNFVMMFVLLFKGREWAWQNDTWRDVAHFNSVQKVWSIVGLVFWLFGIIVIGGIIAAIAIPNFAKFKGKAMQSEAKVQLYTIYSAEMAYKAQFNSFSDDLQKIGYQPQGKGAHYIVGFASNPQLALYCPDCNVDGENFKAVAVGNLNGKADAWTIDNKKQLVNIIDGSK